MIQDLRRSFLEFKGIFVAFLLILCCSFAAIGQIKVTGVVSDQNGALTGVSVRLKKGNKSLVATDNNGAFEVSVAGNDVLIFDLVGYQRKEVPVENRTRINVTMEESSNVLDETIVTGYTTIDRRKTTGSISSVTAKDIENLPAASIDVLLQGKLPGVNVQNFTGMPGVKTSLVIRGNSTIPRSSNQFDSENITSNPLYVIDGVPIADDEVRAYNVTGTNFLSSLNPNDIESVDVLKDASAAALYGARANNGVILVKTKRGRIGTPRISLNVYQGYITKPEKLIRC